MGALRLTKQGTKGREKKAKQETQQAGVKVPYYSHVNLNAEKKIIPKMGKWTPPEFGISLMKKKLVSSAFE